MFALIIDALYLLLPEEGACWWIYLWQVCVWFGFYLLPFCVRVFMLS